MVIIEQVEQFWRERGYLPSIAKGTPSPHIHAVRVDDEDRQAICRAGSRRMKRGLGVAVGLELLRPPCQRCVRQHIFLGGGTDLLMLGME